MEYAQATKWKKPLLIYFLKDDQPDLDVIKLKRELQTTDYCTYREVDNFDNSGNDITNIIWALDLNNISKGNILALRDALDQSLATIVEKGGSPQIIACLVRFDPVVFGCLESKENNGLSYLLDSNAKSLVENRIYQAMTDPSPSVRNRILSLCEKGLFEYDMARSIVEALTTDSNYGIRIRALAVKNAMEHPES